MNNLEEQLNDIKEDFKELIKTRRGRNSIIMKVDAFADFTKLSYNYTRNLFPENEKPLLIELIKSYISVIDELRNLNHKVPKRTMRAYLFFKKIEKEGI